MPRNFFICVVFPVPFSPTKNLNCARLELLILLLLFGVQTFHAALGGAVQLLARFQLVAAVGGGANGLQYYLGILHGARGARWRRIVVHVLLLHLLGIVVHFFGVGVFRVFSLFGRGFGLYDFRTIGERQNEN